MNGAKRPVVFYTLASSGMAHATRAVPMLERLSKTYEVHIFCGGKANKWLGAKFPNVHWIRRFNAVYFRGAINMPLVRVHSALTMPLSLWCAAKVAWYIVTKRPLALITDFEAIGTHAALLVRPFVKTRIICFDNMCAPRVAEMPFTPTAREAIDLARWQKTIRSVVPFADRFLVHAIARPPLKIDHAEYVPPPIRDEFIRDLPALSTDGPIVVCLSGTQGSSVSSQVLTDSGLRFHVYGCTEAREEGLVSYRCFEDAAYKASLASAPFVIVRGLSSTLDALAMKKPVLCNPAKGHFFEHWYNGRVFEGLGVGRIAETLTPETIRGFLDDISPYQQRARELSLFDNERVFAALDRAVRG